jgi:hypothetical protein
MSDSASVPQDQVEHVYLGGKRPSQVRLLRGWVSELVSKGDDVLARVRTDRYPGREFSVYLRRKGKPFGSQRNVTLKKVDLPLVTSPADLNLEVGTKVLFGFPNPSDDFVNPIVRASKLDKVLIDLKARDGDHPGIRKGRHRWTTS